MSNKYGSVTLFIAIIAKLVFSNVVLAMEESSCSDKADATDADVFMVPEPMSNKRKISEKNNDGKYHRKNKKKIKSLKKKKNSSSEEDETVEKSSKHRGSLATKTISLSGYNEEAQYILLVYEKACKHMSNPSNYLGEMPQIVLSGESEKKASLKGLNHERVINQLYYVGLIEILSELSKLEKSQAQEIFSILDFSSWHGSCAKRINLQDLKNNVYTAYFKLKFLLNDDDDKEMLDYVFTQHKAAAAIIESRRQRKKLPNKDVFFTNGKIDFYNVLPTPTNDNGEWAFKCEYERTGGSISPFALLRFIEMLSGLKEPMDVDDILKRLNVKQWRTLSVDLIETHILNAHLSLSLKSKNKKIDSVTIPECLIIDETAKSAYLAPSASPVITNIMPGQQPPQLLIPIGNPDNQNELPLIIKYKRLELIYIQAIRKEAEIELKLAGLELQQFQQFQQQQQQQQNGPISR